MENKTVFLLIGGDDDYDAALFKEEYDAQKVYEEMLEAGLTEDSRYVDEKGDNVEVAILEFGAIDEAFIDFIKRDIQDYDSAKFRDFVKVNPTT